MKQKAKFIFLLSLFTSCSLFQNKDNPRYINSILQEDEIDQKFESFEGGSLKKEKEIHQEIIDASIEMLSSLETGYYKVARDAHAKSHGCLKAHFRVENSNLDEIHRVGIFAKNKTFPAYIRFSNNDQKPIRKDDVLDLRGMSIKLLDVDGPKIMSGYEYARTQDFLMYGSKVFFVKDNKDYIGFSRGLRDGNAVSVLLKEQPKAAIATAVAQAKIRNKKNPLGINYFSATPIRLGLREDKNRTAIKYSATPCNEKKIKNIASKKSHNYMRENLIHTLNRNKIICFDFNVQLQTHPEVMPIEDSTVKWPEEPAIMGKNKNKFSPYKKVATIVALYDENKNLNSFERKDFCEDLAFNPWHALPEHKPLGRTMRMRRDVYRATSEFRRKQNNVSLEEPRTQ